LTATENRTGCIDYNHRLSLTAVRHQWRAPAPPSRWRMPPPGSS